ncbi:MAG: 3-hydroxyacyl-CoA dehydrogenase type-2, partial [Pseudomonadota bacterium]
DHVFIITGAASGLGAACAKTLVAAGGKVVLADVHRDVETRAADLGPHARAVIADVADAAMAQAVVDASLETFGALHGLINCAGIAPAEKVLGRQGVHSLETFERVLRVNLVGTFNMIRLASLAMSRNAEEADGERGVIINTASVAAFEGQVGQVAYSASKAGVAGMTLPLARELSRHGIRVMAIAPGVFETPMLAAMPQEVRESLGAAVPFPKRLGRAEEYAALVTQIISNVMLNGEVIRLDGALRMN